MPDRFVLDAFGLMAYFLDEPGAQRFEELLDARARGDADVSVTSVNLGEAIYGIELRRGSLPAINAFRSIHMWRLSVEQVEEELAVAAAKIKADRRMGYLDCFVVALAQRLDATVLTGDPDFRRVDDLVRIEWLER